MVREGMEHFTVEPEVAKNPYQEIIEFCQTREIDPNQLADAIYDAIEQSPAQDTEALTNLYRQLMDAFNLPWEVEEGRSMLYDVTSTNEEGSDDPEAPRHEDIPKFFATIADLEKRNKGSAQFLLKKYGIRAFHRYGADILETQFEESDIDKPYGVVLASYRDDGDGFSRLHDELLDVRQQLPPGLTFRIIEAKNAYEAARRLVSLHRSFPNQPFRFALVETHSHEGQYIILNADEGNDPKTGLPGAIKKEHLTGEGAKKVGSFFHEDAPIVMMGCKSGMDQGIASVVSEGVDRTLIAPADNTTFAEITFTSFDEDFVPTIDVKYYRNNAAVSTTVHSSKSSGPRN